MARCSHCYRSGHKRPTCPDYRLYLESEEAEDCLSTREEIALKKFRLRDEGKRITSGQTKSGSRRKKSACSFCSSKGHNLRKCPALTKVKKDYAAVNHAFRALLEPVLSDCAPGALVQGGKWYARFDDDRRDTKTCKQEFSWTGMIMGYDLSQLSLGQMIVDEDQSPNQAIKVKKLCHKVMSPSFDQTYHHIYNAKAGEEINSCLDWHGFYAANYAGYEEVEKSKASMYSDGFREVNEHKRRINSLWSDFFGYSNRLLEGGHGDHCNSGRDSQRNISRINVVSPVSQKSGFLTKRDDLEGFDVLMKLYSEKARKRKTNTITYFADALLAISLLVPEKKKIKNVSRTLKALRKKTYEKEREKRSKHSRYRYYGYSYELIESYM